MVEYNAAFFKNIENSFLVLKDWEGQEYALRFLRELMQRSLGAAYTGMGAKPQGGPEEYKRVVGLRDEGVGLKVSFENADKGFLYRFHTDPFPGLKGKVPPEALDATYMDFKVAFLLGPDWTYETTKHLWNGDEYTEHRIFKKGA